MLKPVDLLGLTPEQSRKAQEIDLQVAQARQGIEVWHRLLDRRRSDRKLGLHPITEFVATTAPVSGEQGELAKRPVPDELPRAEREPFYVNSEHEARALLLHSVGYLTNAAGERLAFDKGYGERDKMAEWIIREVQQGALAYIRKRRPFIFGIPIAVGDS